MTVQDGKGRPLPSFLSFLPEEIDTDLVGSRRQPRHKRLTSLHRIDARGHAPMPVEVRLEIDADMIERQELLARAETRAGAEERGVAEDPHLHAEDQLGAREAGLHLTRLDAEVIDRQAQLIRHGALELA